MSTNPKELPRGPFEASQIRSGDPYELSNGHPVLLIPIRPNEMERGPFEASQIRPGDRYELSNGHPIYCAPTGGRGSRSNAIGVSVLTWDPAVDEIGIDTGFTFEQGGLRAPDVAVGNVPDQPGWVRGVPRLAIEYADTGQDEVELADKIKELLAAGTEQIWVVRLEGPRRVEVHAPGQPMRPIYPGQKLEAPGVLANAVLVDALYDRDAAREAVLNNLLKSKGFESLEAVRKEGEKAGIEKGEKAGLRKAIRTLCAVLGIAMSGEQGAALEAMELAELEELQETIVRERRWPG